jgi:hypothetical protein
MAYPATLDSFTNPSGTDTVNVVDHALQHTNANTAITSIETTVGTTAGTNVLKNFAAGDFPARINAGGTLQQTIAGTFNNTTFGTPVITGGTATGMTVNAGTVGTPAITGGTANLITLGTPTLLGVTNNYAYNAAANIAGSSSAFASVSGSTTATITTTNSNKVRFMFTTSCANNTVGGIVHFQILRNPGAVVVGYCSFQEPAANYYFPISICGIDAPSTGAGTYDLQWKTTVSGTSTIGGSTFYLNYSVEEIKAG